MTWVLFCIDIKLFAVGRWALAYDFRADKARVLLLALRAANFSSFLPRAYGYKYS